MGLMNKFFNNTRKPEGFMGKMMAKGMNTGSHAKLANWGLSHLSVNGNENAVDLGCGGGGNLQRLLALLPEGKVIGLDYSEVSVETSKKTNEKAIREGKCKVVQGNVRNMPFSDGAFDLATAFETVYFWPEIGESFKEVCRILKEGGTFLITNESDGKHEASLKWTKIVEGMTVYTEEDLKKLLMEAGFREVEIDDDEANDRLCAVARK